MARPAKMTDETVATITRLIGVGVTVEIAAEVAGITRTTFYDWMQRGERNGKSDRAHRQFRDKVEQARAQAEATLVTRISKAAQNGSWGAAAWLLERRAPERWLKQKGEPHGSDDESAASETRSPAESIRDEIAAARKKRAARA